MGATQTAQWFSAVQQDEIESIRKYKKHFLKVFDTRPAGSTVHTGYCSLMYAAHYNSTQCFCELFDDEFDLFTKNRLANVKSYSSKGSQLSLNAGASVLQIAILKNSIDVIEVIT